MPFRVCTVNKVNANIIRKFQELDEVPDKQGAVFVCGYGMTATRKTRMMRELHASCHLDFELRAVEIFRI
jgi:hypothetical protein